MEEVNVDVLRREVIKPAAPSPRDRLQLSIFDLMCPGIYVPTIFFYKAEDFVTVVPPGIILRNLKSSLSRTLSRFYPLAGRIEGVSINCNDEGAVFTEARTDLLLHDFLRNLNIDSLDRFYPTMAPGDSAAGWPLLSVQVTFFGSGSGVAVSVFASHMVCDVSSLVNFIAHWAATTAKGEGVDTIPFAETTIYPPPPSHMSIQPFINQTGIKKHATNRFVFKSSKIIELKLKAASESVPVPSRVEAISALIYRCAANASRSNFEFPRSTLMAQAMDLRLRIPSTVLPQDVVGNLQTVFYLKNDAESDLKISETVCSFRKAKERTNKMIQENVQGNTLSQYLMSSLGDFWSELKPDTDYYGMSSWCRKPFYEIDFRWGSPVWVGSIANFVNTPYVHLIDSKDGDDVEAWIGLPEQDMFVFHRDQDLLAYAALNPPVLIYISQEIIVFSPRHGLRERSLPCSYSAHSSFYHRLLSLFNLVNYSNFPFYLLLTPSKTSNFF